MALRSEEDLTGPRMAKVVGSPEWCLQTLQLLKYTYENLNSTWREVEQLIRELEEARAWERIPRDQPYNSLDAMLKAELGFTQSQARVTVAARARERGIEAAKATTGEVLPLGRPEKTGNLPILEQGDRAASSGLSIRSQRKLDRLARDHPALHEEVKAGRLSIHAAAKAAGIVRDPTPLEQLQRVWKKATEEERRTFRDWIEEAHS